MGATKVLGRWKMPFSIQLQPTELRVHGELESKLDNKEMLMLLSLQAQSQLGLVKDMRRGTASMSDYPGQSLQLSRHKGTGLILMCISDFSRKPVREHKCFLEDGRKSHLTYRIPEGDLSNRGLHAYMTSNQARKISLYSLGIETGHKPQKNPAPFGEFLRSLRTSHAWKVNRGEHVKPFLQSLKENYAFMTDIEMEQVMILDCRNMGDPASTSMRDHIGWNPFNLKHMCSTRAWKKFWKEMAFDLDEEGLRKAFDEGKEVGGTREESRAVTVEEPETEDAGERGAPPLDTSDIRVMEQSTRDIGPDYADSSESFLATNLRAYASHFWSTQENKYWKNGPDTKEYDEILCFFSSRFENQATASWKKKQRNYGKKKQKEKHGKLLMYSKCGYRRSWTRPEKRNGASGRTSVLLW